MNNGRDETMKQYFCVGSYTEPILFGTGEVFQGKGKGVSICCLEDGKITVLQETAVRNPSFLCLNEREKKIYAVNEMKEYLGAFGGGVTQLRYDAQGNMTQEFTCNIGGTDPCHIIQSPNRQFLSVANFASGSLTVCPLDEQGNLLDGAQTLFQHEGSSVHPVRQKSPHAHSTVFAPDAPLMLVPDLGIDRLVAYRYDGAQVQPDAAATVTVTQGSGPRFGEFSQDGRCFYLIDEISSQIMQYAYENGSLTWCDTVETLPPDYTGENICSDLHITPDGRYLYASNRGHDSLVCYRIGAGGKLSFLRRQPCGGKTPRNFAIEPQGKYLLAGNQDSDTITVFTIEANGALKQVNQVAFGSPVCIQFFYGL